MHMIVVKFEIKNPQEITNSVKFGLVYIRPLQGNLLICILLDFLVICFQLTFIFNFRNCLEFKGKYQTV